MLRNPRVTLETQGVLDTISLPSGSGHGICDMFAVLLSLIVAFSGHTRLLYEQKNGLIRCKLY